MIVTVYATSTCPYCKSLREYLNTHAVTFEEVLVDQTPEKLSQMLTASNGFSAVPFIVITKDNGEMVTVKGFDQDELDKAVGLVDIANTDRQMNSVGQAPEEMPYQIKEVDPLGQAVSPMTPAQPPALAGDLQMQPVN